MQIEKLRKLYDECRHNPKYQHKDLDEDEFFARAMQSFNRLKPVDQARAQKSWADALGNTTPPEELTKENAKQLFLFRYLAQTNLFFLCKFLEQYGQVTLPTHEEICNEFFVQKEPTFTTFEKFANQYTDLKERMLLVPRNGFKSSIDIADCVQWVICFPAVTILILTGVYKLAGDFVGELRQHFTLEENGQADPKTGKMAFGPRQIMDKDSGEWTSSLFQILFPEHCITPGDGSALEFQTPAGGDDKEPTVRAASIEQALSGMHFGVLKLDDVVTNENSQTIDRIVKVNKQININQAMLNPYGFMDVIGTWYDEQDYYGVRIKQEEKFAIEQGPPVQGSVDSGRFNSNVFIKTYLRAAWWLTEAAEKAGKIEAEAVKADWELWFPERLSYDFLQQKLKTNPDEFPIKYLNNPRQLNKVKFPRELLMRRTIPHTQLPSQGIVVMTVDTAYSTKSWADYTVILTAFIYGGRFYVVNMVRGRFNEFELPAVIAAAANKWKPKRIAIEESVGVKWMGRELKREMDKLKISVPVEYVSLGLGSKAKSKAIKAKPVVRLLGDERMYFLNSCEGLQEIYTELEKFTGTSDDAHDDIVSALSLLADVFGAYADMGAKIDFASTQYIADKQAANRHDLIYGLGKFAKYNATNADSPTTVFQAENNRMFHDDLDSGGADPLSDLF